MKKIQLSNRATGVHICRLCPQSLIQCSPQCLLIFVTPLFLPNQWNLRAFSSSTLWYQDIVQWCEPCWTASFREKKEFRRVCLPTKNNFFLLHTCIWRIPSCWNNTCLLLGVSRLAQLLISTHVDVDTEFRKRGCTTVGALISLAQITTSAIMQRYAHQGRPVTQVPNLGPWQAQALPCTFVGCYLSSLG